VKLPDSLPSVLPSLIITRSDTNLFPTLLETINRCGIPPASQEKGKSKEGVEKEEGTNAQRKRKQRGRERIPALAPHSIIH
jgi:hypothetical protein